MSCHARRLLCRVVTPVILALCLSGCADLRYLARAAYEEARLLSRRQPIAAVLSGEADETTRNKLELTLAARAFASARLGLEVGGSYTSVAEVDERHMVYVVSAAHRDRLEPYRWWFPIVGRVPYRGYFERSAARQLVAALERDGYDTYLRRALAFSTLGYFDDPLPSNLLKKDAATLVETILHELLHSTVYVSGQAAFNESVANFVGHRGAIEFFAERGDQPNADLLRARWADALTFAALLADGTAMLEDAYQRGVTEPQRQELFAAIRAHYDDFDWLTDDYEKMREAELNNAVLLARRVYFERLELFEEAHRRFAGDLERTLEWLIAVARSSSEPYETLAASLAQAPATR